MPVQGVGQPNPRHVRFSFRTLRVMITLIFLIASSALNLAMMKHLARIGVNAKNLGRFIKFVDPNWIYKQVKYFRFTHICFIIYSFLFTQSALYFLHACNHRRYCFFRWANVGPGLFAFGLARK